MSVWQCNCMDERKQRCLRHHGHSGECTFASQESVEIKVLRAEVAELTASLETLSKAFVVAQETLCDLVPMVLAIKHQLNVNNIVDEWDIENSKERFKQLATK